MSFDLTTNYGGLELRSPIIVGACPMTANTQSRIALENAGAGAMVLPSLFEEHVIAWKLKNGGEVTEREQRRLDRVDRSMRDSLIPDVETYLAIVNRATTLSSIPVIASLNGESDGDWLGFAGELQDTGAQAIELNIHHRPVGLYDEPAEVEDQVVEFARTLRQSISIPLFLKLHNEYTSVAHLARRLVSGVQGLVLYARDPDIDISLDDCKLRASWGFSPAGSISATLRGLMSVYGHCPSMPLAGSGGIASPEDVVKILLGGADAAMVVSAVYRHGPDVIRTMLDGLTQYMESNRICSLDELRARRPLEFSSDEERLSAIQGMTESHLTMEHDFSAPVIQADKWGHPVPSV